MRRCTMLVAAAVALAVGAQPAFAAPPDGAAGPWADFVVDFDQGSVNPGGFLPGRSDPAAALGPADAPPGNDPAPVAGTFVSLGFGGELTLGFQNPICNAVGADLAIEVREITKEPYPLEQVAVYVSENGGTYHFAGNVTRDGTVGMPAGVAVANFVRLVDINNQADFAGDPNADGYDVDGVKSLNTTCPTGKIEICKSVANGMGGRLFQYSLNGGTPFTVKAGRCTGAITTLPGMNVVRELPTFPPTDVAAVSVRPSKELISQDLENRTVTVRVVTGSTAANETKVTFTNEPGGGATGDLKICKVTETPALVGKLFSFSVNGGPLVSTEAGPEWDTSKWSCRPVGTFQTGSRVTVREVLQPGIEISFIDTDPSERLLEHDKIAGTALVEIGGGQNIVVFGNDPVAPAQTGYIEICKDAALTGPGYTPDPDVSGVFSFTVAPPEGDPFVTSTYAGQCTQPLKVAAGVVKVTEHARAGYTLVDVWTEPDTALLYDNLINREAHVEVPVADDPRWESQVHFVNARDRAQLKICKALGPSSDSLAGRDFLFDVTDLNRSTRSTQSIKVTAPGCRVVGDFPVGHSVEVIERDPGRGVAVSGEGTIVIGPGINTVTITNTAQGVLRICKARVAGVNTQPTFRFQVDGGGYRSVTAGTCVDVTVSAGSHTVREAPMEDYELDPTAPGNGIVVDPPGREQSRDLTNRSVTVNVPGGSTTEVGFTNRIRRGTIVICKTAGSTPVQDYSYEVWVDGQGQSFMVTGIAPRECSDPQGPYPVLRADGQRTQVEVVEGAGPYTVTSIQCDGCRPASSSPPPTHTSNPDLPARYIRFSLAPGTNTVRYTNQAARG